MQWGPWKLDTEHLHLVHQQEGYEVNLKECNSSAAILDWIFQIQHKSWADAATIMGLLQAFEDVLHPQENYCSFGAERHGNGEQLAKAYAAAPGARERLFKSFGR